MASPGNQHCANCIGTLSFPIGLFRHPVYGRTAGRVDKYASKTRVLCCKGIKSFGVTLPLPCGKISRICASDIPFLCALPPEVVKLDRMTLLFRGQQFSPLGRGRTSAVPGHTGTFRGNHLGRLGNRQDAMNGDSVYCVAVETFHFSNTRQTDKHLVEDPGRPIIVKY